jgi:hypothetical protein
MSKERERERRMERWTLAPSFDALDENYPHYHNTI